MKITYRGKDFRGRRKAAYPDIGDQLDAIMKLAQHLQGSGVTLPSEVQQWVSACQAVKDRYPK